MSLLPLLLAAGLAFAGPLDLPDTHKGDLDRMFDGRGVRRSRPAPLMPLPISGTGRARETGVADAIRRIGDRTLDYAPRTLRIINSGTDLSHDILTKIAGHLLPKSLREELKDGGDEESRFTRVFLIKFADSEERFVQTLGDAGARIRRVDPNASLKERSTYEVENEAWRRWARSEQKNVVLDSARDAYLYRYGLDSVPHAAEQWARDKDNWSFGLLLLAVPVGGTILWFSGLRTGSRIGPLKLGMKLSPVRRLHAGPQDKSLGLNLGWKDRPWTLSALWDSNGIVDPRFDSAGIRYSIKFWNLRKLIGGVLGP